MDWTLTIVALILSPDPVEPVQFADPQTIAALIRVGTVLELVGEGQASTWHCGRSASRIGHDD